MKRATAIIGPALLLLLVTAYVLSRGWIAWSRR